MKELKMENQWICTLQHALTRQNYKGKNGKEDYQTTNNAALAKIKEMIFCLK